jgi:hypothetical protein
VIDADAGYEKIVDELGLTDARSARELASYGPLQGFVAR